MPSRAALVVGALLAAAGVALGAYAAHGLVGHLELLGYGEQVDQRVDWFETGVRYQLYHALGMLLVALLTIQTTKSTAYRFATVAFLLGIVLFSGSLYVMTLAPVEWRKLGAVVPLGGVSFLAGWIALAYGAYRNDEL